METAAYPVAPVPVVSQPAFFAQPAQQMPLAPQPPPMQYAPYPAPEPDHSPPEAFRDDESENGQRKKKKKKKKMDKKRRKKKGDRYEKEEAEGSDPRFAASPLNRVPHVRLTPRWKVAMQIFITVSLILAIYVAYLATPRVLKATGWSGLRMPEDKEIPGWALLSFPVVALIPGAYTFYYLKYRFNY
jgi:hypothetical protein